MKVGGYFWGLFASLYCCSHAHKSFVYTMALISKELHKLYSSADYYGLDPGFAGIKSIDLYRLSKPLKKLVESK